MNLQPLRNLINFYRSLKQTVEIITDESIMKYDELIANLIRDQLLNGTDGEGKKIIYKNNRTSKLAENGNYTYAYDRYKRKRGGNTSVVDLKLTGQFVNSLYLDRERIGVYKIISRNNEDLQAILVKNYGDKILQLKSGYMNILVNTLRAEIQFRLSIKIQSI